MSIAIMSAFYPQKRDGLCYVGATVLRGRLTGNSCAPPPIWPRNSARGEICASPSCRICSSSMFPTRARRTSPASWSRSACASRLPLFGAAPSPAPARNSASSPSPKPRASLRWLVDELEERLPQFDQQFETARHRMPQLLRPALDRRHRPRRQENQARRRPHGRLLLRARRLRRQTRAHRPPRRFSLPRRATVPEAIERLLKTYLAGRQENENLRSYFSRFSDEELRAQVAGAVTPAVARDPSPGPVPHAVAD